MNIDYDSWPELGRMGVCQYGGRSGVHVFVYADTLPYWWTVMLDVAYELGPVMYFEGDDEMRRLAVELDIKWMPEGEAEAELERKIFDVRSSFPKRAGHEGAQGGSGFFRKWIQRWFTS